MERQTGVGAGGVAGLRGVHGTPPVPPLPRLAVIGAGAMAQALLEGWLRAKTVDPDRVTVTNRADDARLARCRARYGVRVTRVPRELLDGAELVVLATKPADAPRAIRDWGLSAGDDAPPPLGVSVCAGLTLETLARLAPRVRWARAMPNTACRIGAGATALAFAETLSEEDAYRIRDLFAAVGAVHVLSEGAFDAATAVGGSGPAFIYRVVELLAEAGAAEGLPSDVARALSVQALVGAGRAVEATGLDLAQLRAEITSPGGTTAAGLAVLDPQARALVAGAVSAASRRSRELSRSLAAPPFGAADPSTPPGGRRSGPSTAPAAGPTAPRG